MKPPVVSKGRVAQVLLSVVLVTSLGACTERAAAQHDGGAARELGAADGRLGDLGVPDQAIVPVVDAGGSCLGPPQAFINGVLLALSSIETSTEVMASCCGPGERVVFADYGPRRLSLEIVRFPTHETPPMPLEIDLAQPPAGWVIAARCEPSQDCALLSPQNARFTGTIAYRALEAPPRYVLDICLTALPKDDGSSPPGFQELWLYAKAVTVHRACVVGMDQTCNEDPVISSLRGRCQADSTCVCQQGQPSPATGKCP